MALVTRCPNCATAFLVTPEHLQMHDGNVRCGYCSQIFNSFSALAAVQGAIIRNNLNLPGDDTPQKETPEILTEETSNKEGQNLTASGAIDAADEGYAFDGALPPKSSSIWGLISIFLLVVLMGQVVYLNRAEIAIFAPGVKPYLEQYCEIINCTIPLAQQVRLLSIESSDMQMGTAQSSSITMLTAIVRNKASFPQAFPSIELTLTDTQDQALASRIFTPGEYLKENNNPSVAIEPGKEISVTLYIDSGDLNTAGYRLFLLYP